MTTREAGAQDRLSRTVESLGRLTLVALFTGVETAALVVWLALAGDAAPVSRAAALGLGVLFAGLLLEHFLTDLAVNGVDGSFPVAKGVVFTVTETAVWVLWLVVAQHYAGVRGVLVAGVVLAVLLVPQHTVEDNVLRGRGLFANLLSAGTLGFSILEAAGATVWLLFVTRPDLAEPLLVEAGVPGLDPVLAGTGVLALALFVEHNVGVALSRRGRPGR